ncbi:alpha/beta hydrolase [Neotamlana laminarinivorans]|uniref:Esterase n=1 Tax=Neotamlana laminarinivorans TaxID=2883124 RepID=A0A9X1HY05_9FLAO|nr:alpha/beta hydrolase-fold protein [Tamlana laminarinivorans]MCB4797995.1 esterase [Tamlana laminarinivorans]
MKKNLLFSLIVLASVVSHSQVIYKKLESLKLDQTREIKIQLPRGYENNPEKKYPIFIVLDGDYMFEVVAANVDYLSYWQDMPDAIVVGVNQVDTRFEDSMYGQQNSLPIDSSASFFEFIGIELVPYIEKTYRTTGFRVLVGHGSTANYINYFLLKPLPLFSGYIVSSPELAPNMLDYIPERFQKLEDKTFYYLANTKKDSKSVLEMTSALNQDLVSIDNPNIEYTYKLYEGASHYSLPTRVIPEAIEQFFKIYQPISKEEYQNVILKLEYSPVTYLQEKYGAINDFYGVEKPVIINDFKAIAAAIEKNEGFEYYEELSKIANKYYPDSLLSGYYLGRFYEETGKAKKAMHTYQEAFAKEEIAGITKDYILELVDAIKDDFGY